MASPLHTLLAPIVTCGAACATALVFVCIGIWRACTGLFRAICGAPAARRSSGVSRVAAGDAAGAMLRTLVDIDGILTEVLEWPAVASAPPRDGPSGGAGARTATPPLAPAVVLVFFCGNPGSPLFYAHYLTQLHELSARRLTIYCPSHAGQTVATASRARFDMRANVEHKNAFVRRILERHGSACSLILAGHSVGAYCAGQALVALPASASVSRVLALFPTLIDIRLSPNGKQLTPVFFHYKAAAWLLVHAIVALPRALRELLLRRLVPQLARPAGGGGGGAAPSTTGTTTAARRDAPGALPATSASIGGGVAAAVASILHPDVAHAALLMASHEMADIGPLGAAEATALQRLEGRCVLYFGESDGWVPSEQAESLCAALPRATAVRCREGHRHAFVLEPESAARMSELTWSWIQDALPPL